MVNISYSLWGGGGGGRQKTLFNIYERVNTASHFASISFGTLLRDKCHEEID